MGIERWATPEDRLRALAGGHASALATLARMQAGTRERSGLDEDTYLLVRVAALVASDATPLSYRAHLGADGDARLPTAKVLAALAAIAPVVGSARVLSAAAGLAQAGLIPPEGRRITPSG